MPNIDNLEPALQESWQRLLDGIRPLGPAIVAFSGGVDSALLLAAAKQALGPKVKAALCVGAFTPPWEAERARRVAADLGVELMEMDAGELADPETSANDRLRCYYCKRLRLGLLVEKARDMGFDTVLEGSQADDAGEYRPGSKAVKELGVKSPLADAGLDKAQVRSLSRALGLITADVPSGACLATRVPTGTPLTQDALSRIGRAESAVRGLISGQVRLRDHFPLARLELGQEGMALLAESPDLGSRISNAVKAVGYGFVCLDLDGYRTGGADEAGAGRQVLPKINDCR